MRNFEERIDELWSMLFRQQTLQKRMVELISELVVDISSMPSDSDSCGRYDTGYRLSQLSLRGILF